MKFITKNGQTWFLHTADVIIGKGQVKRTNYFFKREKDDRACDMPDGYKVFETKTGMPVLKRL